MSRYSRKIKLNPDVLFLRCLCVALLVPFVESLLVMGFSVSKRKLRKIVRAKKRKISSELISAYDILRRSGNMSNNQEFDIVEAG